MYQFRFVFGNKELANIYKDKKISKHFNSMKDNTIELLQSRVSSIYGVITDQSTSYFLQHDLAILQSDIVSDFYKNMRQKIWSEAIELSIKQKDKFNIKDNIVEILDGRYVLDCILGEYLLYDIYSLMRDKAGDNKKLISEIENLEIFEKINQM